MLDGNTHLLGTVLQALREGGVGGRAGVRAGAELDRVVRELPLVDADVAVAFGAAARHGHREAVCGHLGLHGLVGRQGGDGDCDSRV